MGTLQDDPEEQGSASAMYQFAAWVGAMVVIIVVAVAAILWSWTDTATDRAGAAKILEMESLTFRRS